jgi:hypothetical protein
MSDETEVQCWHCVESSGRCPCIACRNPEATELSQKFVCCVCKGSGTLPSNLTQKLFVGALTFAPAKQKR